MMGVVIQPASIELPRHLEAASIAHDLIFRLKNSGAFLLRSDRAAIAAAREFFADDFAELARRMKE